MRRDAISHKKQFVYDFIVSTSALAYQIAFARLARIVEMFTNCGCCGYVFYVIYSGVWARALAGISVLGPLALNITTETTKRQCVHVVPIFRSGDMVSLTGFQ